jgi:hypothetical protein
MMWAVEVVDLVAADLESAGIQPRDPDGPLGIALVPTWRRRRILMRASGRWLGGQAPLRVH